MAGQGKIECGRWEMDRAGETNGGENGENYNLTILKILIG